MGSFTWLKTRMEECLNILIIYILADGDSYRNERFAKIVSPDVTFPCYYFCDR